MNQPIILLVDDEKIVTDTLVREFEQYVGDSFQIQVAHSVDEAIEIIDFFIASNQHVHAVISDWIMPGKNGDELLLQINQKSPDTRLILLSGYADAQVIQKLFLKCRDFFYVRKPWQKEDLFQLIY